MSAGRRAPTRPRILAAAAALIGARGVDAVPLDEIAAAVGVRKQTVLYWFATKDELVDAVFADAIGEVATVIEAAVRAAPETPLERVDAVVVAVFRAAVRKPELLGLLRELNRLDGVRAARLGEQLEPVAARAVAYLAGEMDAGRLRRADPRLLVSMVATTVTGIATDPALLRAVGWTPSPAELRRLRRELRAFLHAALAP